MNEIEKAERLNEIETNLIGTIKSRYSDEREITSAISLLAKRPGKKIDEVLLGATEHRFSEVSKAAFKALEGRISYLDSK
jgi:hypothetical protein